MSSNKEQKSKRQPPAHKNAPKTKEVTKQPNTTTAPRQVIEKRKQPTQNPPPPPPQKRKLLTVGDVLPSSSIASTTPTKAKTSTSKSTSTPTKPKTTTPDVKTPSKERQTKKTPTKTNIDSFLSQEDFEDKSADEEQQREEKNVPKKKMVEEKKEEEEEEEVNDSTGDSQQKKKAGGNRQRDSFSKSPKNLTKKNFQYICKNVELDGEKMCIPLTNASKIPKATWHNFFPAYKGDGTAVYVYKIDSEYKGNTNDTNGKKKTTSRKRQQQQDKGENKERVKQYKMVDYGPLRKFFTGIWKKFPENKKPENNEFIYTDVRDGKEKKMKFVYWTPLFVAERQKERENRLNKKQQKAAPLIDINEENKEEKVTKSSSKNLKRKREDEEETSRPQKKSRVVEVGNVKKTTTVDDKKPPRKQQPTKKEEEKLFLTSSDSESEIEVDLSCSEDDEKSPSKGKKKKKKNKVEKNTLLQWVPELLSTEEALMTRFMKKTSNSFLFNVEYLKKEYTKNEIYSLLEDVTVKGRIASENDERFLIFQTFIIALHIADAAIKQSV